MDTHLREIILQEKKWECSQCTIMKRFLRYTVIFLSIYCVLFFHIMGEKCHCTFISVCVYAKNSREIIFKFIWKYFLFNNFRHVKRGKRLTLSGFKKKKQTQKLWPQKKITVLTRKWMVWMSSTYQRLTQMRCFFTLYENECLCLTLWSNPEKFFLCFSIMFHFTLF